MPLTRIKTKLSLVARELLCSALIHCFLSGQSGCLELGKQCQIFVILIKYYLLRPLSLIVTIF